MKELPAFKSEEEEAEFWDTHDTLDHTEEWDELITGGPKTETLNIRIEPQVKAKIEEYARFKNADVSDMVRAWIYECLEREIRVRFPDMKGSSPPGTIPESRLLDEIQGRLDQNQEEILKAIYSLIHASAKDRQQQDKLESPAHSTAKKASPGKKQGQKSTGKKEAAARSRDGG
jgi:hypothetical protein